MLVINKEQFKAFESANAAGFVEFMQGHIAEHFPAHTQLLGQKGMVKLIKQARESALARGFRTRYEACLFIDLAVMLGSGFYTDPLFPWSPFNTTHDTVEYDEHRIDRLYGAAMKYLDETIGPGNVFPLDQLEHFQFVPMKGLKVGKGHNLVEDIMIFLKRFWWAKYHQAKEPVIKQMVHQGIQVAAKFGFTSRHIAEYFVILMFLLGHEFYQDPNYSYLSDILNDEALADENDKYEKLYACVREKIAKGLAV